MDPGIKGNMAVQEVMVARLGMDGRPIDGEVLLFEQEDWACVTQALDLLTGRLKTFRPAIDWVPWIAWSDEAHYCAGVGLYILGKEILADGQEVLEIREGGSDGSGTPPLGAGDGAGGP
jgi:hypothetical protein